MQIEFYKYQGTGNDFVLIDNREGKVRLPQAKVEDICNRRFGIGADGLILLEKPNGPEGEDFYMRYYNADGGESTMCGNGGRCIVAFAHFLGIIDKDVCFSAIDGQHLAEYSDLEVKLQMIDVAQVFAHSEGHFILDTGSPHYVQMCRELQQLDIVAIGKSVRFSERYAKEGINVNAVERLGPSAIAIRTYERGVEDETLSCGTGSVAGAIAFSISQQIEDGYHEISVQTQGGMLRVRFKSHNGKYSHVYLCGPAKQVFRGIIEV